MTFATAKRRNAGAPAEPKAVRCAIYCRQSVDRSTGADLGSIEAQREVCAAYIASQKHAGWLALPDLYADAGFGGATLERPAFARLMKEIEAGRVNCLVTYKVDRISRSIVHFGQIIHTLEKHGVELVSVTEGIATNTPAGKLLRNLLMTFAEFERDQTAQRTRDKIRQARLRGLWAGGRAALGYSARRGKLVVDEDEAVQVRAIFQLYARLGSLLAVVEELRHRCWTNKSQKVHGVLVPGKPFDKGSVRRVLGNVLYTGRLLVDGEIRDAVHEPIVGRDLFDLVQTQLKSHARDPGPARHNRSGHLLLGIARCVCGSAMSHHFSQRGNRRYGFYVCVRAMKQGAASCPQSRISTRELDRFVVEKLTTIGQHPDVITETIAAARRAIDADKSAIDAELRRLDGERKRLEGERANLVLAIAQGGASSSALTNQINETERAVQDVCRRADEQRGRLASLEASTIDEAYLRRSLESFDGLWAEMTTAERARVLGLLIETIVFDGKSGEISITFRPSGVRLLASEVEQRREA